MLISETQQELEKSIQFFKALIKKPESPLSEQAKVGLEILQEKRRLKHLLREAKQVRGIIEIEEMNEEKPNDEAPRPHR